MSDPNILNVFPECSEKLYPNKGKFTVKQLLKADMVKSAFSAGKRVEHMWVKVFEVQAENHLVKGTLDNTPTEITHLTLGNIVFVPFKDVEDIWIEGQVPESVKRLLEIKEEELRAEEFARSLFEDRSTADGVTKSYAVQLDVERCLKVPYENQGYTGWCAPTCFDRSRVSLFAPEAQIESPKDMSLTKYIG